MPYIQKEDRKKLRPILDAFNAQVGTINSGKLNYLITRMLCLIVAHRGKSYDLINQLIGVLQCVAQEFYRRGAARYEDQKCKENGDVFVADDLQEVKDGNSTA